MSDHIYNTIAPSPTIAEEVRMFDNWDLAIGWAIENVDNGLLDASEMVSFCKALKLHEDPYTRGVELTGWAEEVANRKKLAGSINGADEE